MRPAATLLFFYPPGTSWSCEPACFCASEDSVGVQGKQGAKTMHERHVSRAEKQNLQLTFILNTEGLQDQGRRIWVWVCCHPEPPQRGSAGGRSLSAVTTTFAASPWSMLVTTTTSSLAAQSFSLLLIAPGTVWETCCVRAHCALTWSQLLYCNL